VIPCFNSAKYLATALHSVATQLYQNIQLVVVNDGSADDSESIIERYVDAKRDVYIKFEENRGLAAALNAGLRAATGDYILRFDADDIMYAWRVHDQVGYLVENPKIDLMGTAADLIGVASGCYVSPASQEAVRDCFLAGNPFIHPTIAFSRRLIDTGLFAYDESCPTEEDYELWSRILTKCSVFNSDRRSICYRIHSSNNQRHPLKRSIKQKAIMQYLSWFNESNTELVDALADFQCSGYITQIGFKAMKDYANESRTRSLPRLGWLHDDIVNARSYAEFMWASRKPRRKAYSARH
jgi:glycosyltransferase involved in cell wall biosynthesis